DQAAAPNDELGYIQDLAKGLPTVGITGKAFVIDTGRDGVPNVRTSPGNWCNIKGAGLGERPQSSPEPNIDAYLWIKVPGESDGAQNKRRFRYFERQSRSRALAWIHRRQTGRHGGWPRFRAGLKAEARTAATARTMALRRTRGYGSVDRQRRRMGGAFGS